ncbi:MAG: peptidase T [Saprospiraceae bacterium]|nr:peptidase T [Saprospiraceae bacterium]
MFDINSFPTTAERFMRYARIDTTADPQSDTYPSSEKQKDLTRLIFHELQEAGIECEMNEYGYVYAWLRSNVNHEVPAICFCAHLDTAPDCSGTDVKPILHSNYQLQDIVLPDDSSIVISPKEFSELNVKKGEDIITASGKTLLGSDDKSGVTTIMEAALYLNRNPQIKHGDLCILFTTDEEIGRGVDKVDVQKVGAQYAYTMDSGEKGCFEDETFSADACTIAIQGVSTHPGYAKNKMQNAIKIASDIIANLPKDRLSPESTEEYEGFVHPTRLVAELDKASIDFIIRNFKTDLLDDHYNEIISVCNKVMEKYPKSSYTISRREQYRNMKEILDQHPIVSKIAEEAIVESGVKLKKGKIRGGTDGSRLSFMGLPCPNIFAGEQAIHSRKEWVSVQDMQKASEVIVRILMRYCERSKIRYSC